MTEAEWLACGDPEQLLREARHTSSKRKRRLFGCASCRHIWDLIADDRSRAAVHVAEQFADGLVGNAELTSARAAAQAAAEERAEPPYIRHWAARACYCAAMQSPGNAIKAWQSAASVAQMVAASQVGSGPPSHPPGTIMKEAWQRELPRHADLLRDIFGNPFRPVIFDPAWRTATVSGLAQALYEEHAFDRLPILADALEDAGCTDGDILSHCRGGGEHARGCWVVDIIHGKA